MKKDYWQKRTVKAEETLITLKSIADTSGYTRVSEMIDGYFDSVAAGRVNDVVLPAGDEQ